jgi:hypothetical protein
MGATEQAENYPEDPSVHLVDLKLKDFQVAASKKRLIATLKSYRPWCFLEKQNSRTKDFYDVRRMSLVFEFDGRTLVEAIEATFNRLSVTVGNSARGTVPISQRGIRHPSLVTGELLR